MSTIGKSLLRLISAVPVARTAVGVGMGKAAVGVGAGVRRGWWRNRNHCWWHYLRDGGGGRQKRRVGGTRGWLLFGVGSRDWYRCNASGRWPERLAEWVLKMSIPEVVYRAVGLEAVLEGQTPRNYTVVSSSCD